MLRNSFYSSYKEEKKGRLKMITSVTLFYLTGISLLAWIVVIGYQKLPIFTEMKWLILIVLAVGLYFPLFLLYSYIRYKKGYKSSIKSKIASRLIVYVDNGMDFRLFTYLVINIYSSNSHWIVGFNPDIYHCGMRWNCKYDPGGDGLF